MKVILSLLRGINVSGQKKILMKDLKALYEELHFKQVNTYLQSGNVVFENNGASPRELSKIIEQKIFEKYNFDVSIMMRTPEEMQTVLNENPFLKEKDIAIDRLYVTFLAEQAKQELVDKIKAFNCEPDKFIIGDKEIYLYCPIAYGNSKLSNNFFENKLKVTATTRNWRTVNELFKMMIL